MCDKFLWNVCDETGESSTWKGLVVVNKCVSVTQCTVTLKAESLVWLDCIMLKCSTRWLCFTWEEDNERKWFPLTQKAYPTEILCRNAKRKGLNAFRFPIGNLSCFRGFRRLSVKERLRNYVQYVVCNTQWNKRLSCFIQLGIVPSDKWWMIDADGFSSHIYNDYRTLERSWIMTIARESK